MSSGDPETRKRILDKTWQLMEKRGGQHVRISDIARAAGVSRQAIYLHFGSRAELLIATAHHLDDVKKLSDRLKGLSSEVNALQTLENYVDFWANYIPEIHGLAKALLAMREKDEDAAAAWDDRMKAVREGWRAVIECLVREGLLAPEWNPDQAAEAAWAITSITVWENLTIECGWSTNEYIDRMKTVLKRMLVKDAL